MPGSRARALTPDALAMIESIARNGSFAAAARELGRVPSALTYSVRQLEDALDVLLFDRATGQAQPTAAGKALLVEAQRLRLDLESVANRVRRIATGWESELTVAVDDLIDRRVLLDLAGDFLALRGEAERPHGTRLRLRTEVMNGLWESLVTGQADLVIGLNLNLAPEYMRPGLRSAPLGDVRFVFVTAPGHPLAGHEAPLADAQLAVHRAIAVADSAARFDPMTLNLMPGQDVLTVPSLGDKLQALMRGLGAGFMPLPLVRESLAAGVLVAPAIASGDRLVRLGFGWRDASPSAGGDARNNLGLGLRWWLDQLERSRTRDALIQGRPVAPAAGGPADAAPAKRRRKA